MRPYLKKIAPASAFLVVLALTLTPVTAFAKGLGVTPQRPSCSPGWKFDSLANAGRNFIPVTGLYGQTNHNTKPYLPVTLTATTAGTVAFTSGDSTGVGLNFEFLQVKADVNSSVTYSFTTTVGHAIKFNVYPGQTVYGKYGVERQIATGHLYYLNSACQVSSDHGRVTTYSPWYATWDYWCVNPSTCHSS